MNILCERINQKGALMIVPISAVQQIGLWDDGDGGDAAAGDGWRAGIVTTAMSMELRPPVAAGTAE